MRRVLGLVLLSFLSFSTYGEDIELFTSRSADTVYSYTIPSSKLAGMPRWNAQDRPPLSIDEAISKATESVKKRHSKFDGFKVFSIDLRMVSWPIKHQSIWYYHIGFRPSIDGHELTVGHYSSVVLMDGSTIEPMINEK